MILKLRLKLLKHLVNPFYLIIDIYAIQIRDKGFINSYHSHRSVYDIYKLDCKKSLTIKNIKKDIFIKHFFITINKFKIFDIHIKTTLLSSYFDKLFRFLFISFLKIFTVIDIYIFKLSLIIQLFFNNELRERALNKISIHYNNKTLLNYLYTWLKIVKELPFSITQKISEEDSIVWLKASNRYIILNSNILELIRKNQVCL